MKKNRPEIRPVLIFDVNLNGYGAGVASVPGVLPP